MIIKSKINGNCGGHALKKGERVNLPDEIVKALDPNDYDLIGEAKAEPTPEPVEEESKEVKKAKNKGPKKKASK